MNRAGNTHTNWCDNQLAACYRIVFCIFLIFVGSVCAEQGSEPNLPLPYHHWEDTTPHYRGNKYVYIPLNNKIDTVYVYFILV